MLGPSSWLGSSSWLGFSKVFAGLTVGLQIPYPLAAGEARHALTQLSVLTFAAATFSHAMGRRGATWAAGYLAVTVGGGLVAETIGVHTGWPFGRYVYADSLGPTAAGVPVVVPLAWAMMAYPVLLFSQYAVGGRPTAGRARQYGTREPRARQPGARQPGARRLRRLAATAGFGGLLLASWDLFLDPQMVGEGHWSWITDSPALNGVPLTNAAGWVLVGTCLTGLLALLPAAVAREPGTTREQPLLPDDAVPVVLLGWTYISSVLANLAFFDSPAVGLTGGAVMGALLAAGLWSGRRRIA